MYQGKNGSREYSNGNKTVPGKVATTHTEDGYNTGYLNKHYNVNQKDEGTQDDRGKDGGTNSILRIKEQESHLILPEHFDDYDEEMNPKAWFNSEMLTVATLFKQITDIWDLKNSPKCQMIQMIQIRIFTHYMWSNIKVPDFM